MAFVIPSIFEAIDKFTKPVNKFQEKLDEFGKSGDTAAARVERKFRRLGDASLKVAKQSAVVGLAIAAPLILAGKEAVQYEDKLADVAKTTGLQGTELEKFSSALLAMSSDTRTSIDDLLKIGEIGGQLGIAKDELIPFTDAVNKFNVAIGADFSGGVEQAVSEIGNIKTLFKETRGIKIAEAIQKTGSVINELGAQGSATSANISDFTLRLGALPDALKPSVTNTLALGAFLEESGINAQIASGGLTNLLLVAGKNIPEFSKQMGIGEKAASDLLNTDPTEFVKKFSSSLNGLSADQLAKKLAKLEVGSQETIKVVGALGAGTQRLGQLQQISNQAYAEGTSLQNEYNKKNETSAANIAKVQNQFKALAIGVGQQVLPVLSQLISIVSPIIKTISEWAQRNPKLFKTVILLAVGLSTLSFAVSAIAGTMAIASKAMVIWANMAKIATAAQWVWNAAMSANPIGLIIIGIAALIALVAVVVAKYDQWGATLTFLMGPLGLIINLIQSFRRNWDMITEAFANGGILAGLKAIGATLLDAVLMPLQQLLSIIAKITGADWANFAVKKIEDLRAGLGVDVVSNESKGTVPAVNPELSKQEALTNRLENTEKQKVNIDINDTTGKASVSSDNDIVPIKLSSTRNGF